jgi:hypothetical protein
LLQATANAVGPILPQKSAIPRKDAFALVFIVTSGNGRRTVTHLQAGEQMQPEIIFRPIGTVHPPSTEPTGMPIQPSADSDTTGVMEILPECREGLDDLEGFSHLILLTYFRRTQGLSLKVTPFLRS